MATGEVAFFDESQCRYISCSIDKKLAKSILKSKREEYPNLQKAYFEKMNDLEKQQKDLAKLEVFLVYNNS